MMNSFPIPRLISNSSALPLRAPRRAADGARSHRLPVRLQQALTYLSGQDLSAVRVHHYSPLPALLGVRAFVLGIDIYLQPGADDALPHEAWHVVQQQQGRVRATGSVYVAALAAEPIGCNEEEALEIEAEVMGGLAEQLARSGTALPASGALRQAVACPLVIQKITRIQDINYGSVQLAELQEGIKTNLPNDLLKVSEFGNITKDILEENLDFPTWADVEREIRVRDVGYRVEAKMRALLTDHQNKFSQIRDKKKKAQDVLDKELAAIETAYQDAETEIQLTEKQKKIDECNKQFEDVLAALNKEVMTNVIFWGPPTLVQKDIPELHTSPMAEWLSGQTNALPYRMNCWEAVVYSAYLANLVTPSYIAWADGRYPIEPRLAAKCNDIMDYYYVSINESPNWKYPDATKRHAGPPGWDEQKHNELGIRRKTMNDAERKADAINDCKENDKLEAQYGILSWVVPKTRVIPRGRVLIFNSGAHVAISTGHPIDMTRKDGVPLPKSVPGGHGIIELDGNGYNEFDDLTQKRIFEEKAMEDLKLAYLGLLVVAPFPICDESKQSTITIPDPNAKIDENAIAENIKKSCYPKWEAKIQNAQKQLKAHEDRLQLEKDEKLLAVINAKIKTATKGLRDIESKREKEFQTKLRAALRIATQEAVVKRTYKWEPCDPYKQKVKFPGQAQGNQ